MDMSQKKGLQIESADEVNQMFKEIAEFTIRGMAEPDILCKQFYLERIWITLGMSLVDVRENLSWIEVGVKPTE
jgi:hypothetical protein